MANSPDVSRNSFDFARRYGPVISQQGVPLMDSDLNEMMDNLWIRGGHVVNHATVGDCRLEHTQLGGTKASNSGMQIIQHAVATSNDFTITDGWAMVGGVLVPSTASSPPGQIDYADQIIFTGTVTSVGAGNLYDTNKNWLAAHSLAGCRVKMTSGLESGNFFTVTGLVSATAISLSGGTATIAAADTYEIYPPALTTPGGGDRDDLVYLMVFFDDISTEEDTDITHPGTGIESVHKSKITSVIRVIENSTTMPSSTEANLTSYGMRYLKLGILERLNGNANILTAMITNEDNIRGPLAHANAGDIAFDDTVMTGIGYPASTYIQDAVDNIIQELNTSDGAGLIQGDAISDSPDSLAAGTLQVMIAGLLDLLNSRIRQIHPTSSSSNPVLVWRSHNIASDAAVTGQTISLYFSNSEVVLCRGMYLSGATAYDAPVTPESKAYALIIGTNTLGLYYKTMGGGTWTWRTDSQWSKFFDLTAGAGTPTIGPSSAGSFALADGNYFRFLDPGAGDADYCLRWGATPTINHVMKNETIHFLVNGALPTPGTGDTAAPLDLTYSMQSLQFDGDSGQVRFLATTKNRSSYTNGHSLASASWSAKWNFMQQADDYGSATDYVYNCFNAFGNVYEEVRVALDFSATVSSGTIIAALRLGCNFRNRFNAVPSSLDITGMTHTNLLLWGVTDIDNWGFFYTAYGSAAASNYSHEAYGTVACYQ